MTALSRKRVAVLISGRGSNLEALIRACAPADFPAEIVTVVSNRPDAGGLEKARRAGLPTTVIDHTTYANRDGFENALHDHLTSAAVDLICLAGFMRLLGPSFVNRWRDRLLNIHPSLLPAFKGLDTHERALAAGVRFHGCTVHLVRPEMDAGPILIQGVVPVRQDDTPATLGKRVLDLEHRLYPEALRLVATGRLRLESERVLFDDSHSPNVGLTNPVCP